GRQMRIPCVTETGVPVWNCDTPLILPSAQQLSTQPRPILENRQPINGIDYHHMPCVKGGWPPKIAVVEIIGQKIAVAGSIVLALRIGSVATTDCTLPAPGACEQAAAGVLINRLRELGRAIEISFHRQAKPPAPPTSQTIDTA